MKTMYVLWYNSSNEGWCACDETGMFMLEREKDGIHVFPTKREALCCRAKSDRHVVCEVNVYPFGVIIMLPDGNKVEF